MDMHMVVNQWLRFSHTLYVQLSSYVEFKADFHKFSIKAHKDPEQKWHVLPYMVTDTDIQEVVGL